MYEQERNEEMMTHKDAVNSCYAKEKRKEALII